MATDTVLEAQVFPVNELGEIVMQAGVGTTNVVGYVPSNFVPSDATTKKMVVVGAGGGGGSYTVPVSATSRQATITTENISQVLLPANANRSGFVFQNNSIYLMWINLFGSAAFAGSGSIVVTPGATYTSEPASVSSSQVSVVCARPGVAFNCIEYSQISGVAPSNTPTNRSGTITVASKSQLLMPSNALRKGFIIQNVSKFPIFIQEIIDSSSSGLSRKLTAYESITSEAFGASTSQFSILGRTANAAYTALEY